MKYFTTLIALIVLQISLSAQNNFFTSLHGTRNGFEKAYSSENNGMEFITGISIDELNCKKCHSVTGFYANGAPIINYYPICFDCHNFPTTTSVIEESCLNCHRKQNYERELYFNTDVHQLAGLTCIDCHSKEEIHGEDGIDYSSLKEPGAVKVKCNNCHTQLSHNASHNIHLSTVDCSACHAVSVITCVSCHFETYQAAGEFRTINQMKDFKLLIKKDGKIRLGTFSTQSFGEKTNLIISSSHSHIIKKNAATCSDCHQSMGHSNSAIEEYNSSGFITLTKWDAVTKTINGPGCVVPLPADWSTSIKVDHATYTGNPEIFPTDPELWEFLKSETDNAHLYYAEPLDSSTLEKLGFTRFPTEVELDVNQYPAEFVLYQNYPNPFNPVTKISWETQIGSWQTLKVYDLQGNEVATLVDEFKSAGEHEVKFDGSGLSSGLYFYTLRAGKSVQTKKLILLK